jgi:hypothetical protein
MARGALPLTPWLACIATVLAACGSPSTPPPDSPPPSEAKQQQPTATENACELLTKTDAEAALGSPVEDIADESRPTPLGDKVLSGRCFYKGDGGRVSLTVQKHIDAAYAAERFAKLRDRHDTDPSFRPQSGLGEDAFAEHDSLHVRRSDLLITVTLERTGERKLKHYGDQPGLEALAADERKIAEQALQRLPPMVKS